MVQCIDGVLATAEDVWVVLDVVLGHVRIECCRCVSLDEIGVAEFCEDVFLLLVGCWFAWAVGPISRSRGTRYYGGCRSAGEERKGEELIAWR